MFCILWFHILFLCSSHIIQSSDHTWLVLALISISLYTQYYQILGLVWNVLTSVFIAFWFIFSCISCSWGTIRLCFIFIVSHLLSQPALVSSSQCNRFTSQLTPEDFFRYYFFMIAEVLLKGKKEKRKREGKKEERRKTVFWFFFSLKQILDFHSHSVP